MELNISTLCSGHHGQWSVAHLLCPDFCDPSCLAERASDDQRFRSFASVFSAAKLPALRSQPNLGSNYSLPSFPVSMNPSTWKHN